MGNILGPNPLETAVQAASAIATAAAAIFAALSARSAAESAKEMERARELSNAPVITITPNQKEIGYRFDLINSLDGQDPYQNHFSIENHGNGPALNLAIFYTIELTEPLISQEILIVESTGLNSTKCFASCKGIHWETRHPADREYDMKREGNDFIVSLAKSEVEQLSIPNSLMNCWILDAISFKQIKSSKRGHVAHLAITVTFDTVLRKAQQQTFRFHILSTYMPDLESKHDAWGVNFRFSANIEPTVIR